MKTESELIKEKFLILGKKFEIRVTELKSWLIIKSGGVYTPNDLREIMDFPTFYGVSCNKDKTMNFCFKLKQ